MVLHAYVDDSSSEGGDGRSVTLLAGYVGRADSWALLHDEWEAELNRDLPLSYFKMKEAAACRGEFHGFSCQERDERLARFVELAIRAPLIGIHASVETDNFNEYAKDLRDIRRKSPYFLLFHSIINLIWQWMEAEGKLEDIDFISMNRCIRAILCNKLTRYWLMPAQLLSAHI